MAETAVRPLTFEEFVRLDLPGRFELVNGRPEELVSPKPLHAWTGSRIAALLDPYLEQHDPNGYWGVELDIPTIPYHGRRPDFVYYSAADAAQGIDLQKNQVLGIPTLVVEVLSDDDRQRDQVTKREEYAKAGIPHYWLLDPQGRSVRALALQEGRYEAVAEFSGEETLMTPLFPGLQIPLKRLFRS